MILEHIKINNIRSIKNLELILPQTTMLFFGDIGSGKSSVLKAIEFALFGILKSADLSGDSILRRGENKGFVELSFLLDGDRYKVKRGLSRSEEGRVSQTKGFLTVNDSQTNYAATDLRRKILEALNYSVTRYERAQSIDLFRYTVYTPQESVKEILEADPEKRFEILKDVFGIEKYEVVLKNLNIINDHLRYKLKEIEIQIKQLEGIEDLLLQKEEEFKEQKIKVTDLERESTKKEKEIDNVQKKLDKIKAKREDLLKISVELENKEKILKETIESKEKSTKDLDTAKKNVITHEEEIKKIPVIKLTTNLTEEEIQNQISDLRKQISKYEKKRAVIEQKVKDREELLEQGKCSLCGQEIHDEERFKEELDKALTDANSLTKEIDLLTKNIENLKQNLKELQEFTANKAKKELYEKLVEASKNQEKQLQIKCDEEYKKVEALQKELIGILQKFNVPDSKNLKKLESEIKENLISIEQNINGLKSEKNDIDIKLSAEKKTLEYIEKEINELKENIELKKVLNENSEYLTGLKNWIRDQFPILLRDIERQILVSSARHFNTFFKEWFNVLVESGNIEVEIRPDDFQPIINVNGYESPFRDLSGGEKSALSLSYRLASAPIDRERGCLNTVTVQKICKVSRYEDEERNTLTKI